MALEQRTKLMPWFDAYRYFFAPLIAFLPAALAYPCAVLFGDFLYRVSPRAKKKIVTNLERFALGGATEAERDRTAREYFRLRCCEAMEVVSLLRGTGLVEKSLELRGLDELESSLRSGKGIMLCGAHFGSFEVAISFLGTKGYPATPLMRRPSSAGPGASAIQRAIFWAKSYALLHNMRRPNISVQTGDPKADITTATVAAKYLRGNEIIYINLDATVVPGYRNRALAIGFLGNTALFLPGAISIAKVTASKVHVLLAYRSGDWRHQRLTISPAVPMEGDVKDAFVRCLSLLEQAVQRFPAHWEMWDLIPEQWTYFPGLGSNER